VTYGPDALLTGIPRSGTTLACALLNRLPDTIALNEPMEVHKLPDVSARAELLESVRDFLMAQRRSILDQGTAVARITHGLSDENTFADPGGRNGLRKSSVRRAEVPITKALREDFLLVVKHPNAFAALLPILVGRFDCFAMVRDPVSVVASWRTLEIPLSQGHAPAAEAQDSQLRRSLRSQSCVLKRQLVLLDWYFRRFNDWLPPERIIRYEDMIASGGRALSVITPEARNLDSDLQSRNPHMETQDEVLNELRDRIRSTDGSWSTLYK